MVATPSRPAPSSRPRLQTPSEQQAQATKPEPKTPSCRPEPFDELCRQLELAEAGTAIFTRALTQALNERRKYPRWSNTPVDQSGLMRKMATVVASSDLLTDEEKWAIAGLYESRHKLTLRGGAILRHLPPSAMRWLAESTLITDPFAVAEEVLLLANALGDIGRMFEHAGDAAVKQLRAAAAGLGSPGWGMCLWRDRHGNAQVRSQWMGEEAA